NQGSQAVIHIFNLLRVVFRTSAGVQLFRQRYQLTITANKSARTFQKSVS
ncbi:hypothetical protein D018_1958B, partial [Vibrio parahaemolyticus VP2007-007]